MRCRVCKEHVSYMGWTKHIEKHKKEFCRIKGISLENWRSINWENVVMLFNPKEANKDKLSEPVITPQTTLTDY